VKYAAVTHRSACVMTQLNLFVLTCSSELTPTMRYTSSKESLA
jgi:hypothetical protein